MTQLTSQIFRDELQSFAEGTLQSRLDSISADLRKDIKEVKLMMRDFGMQGYAPKGDWSLRANGCASKNEVPIPLVSNSRKSPKNFAEGEPPATATKKAVDLDELENVHETLMVPEGRHSPRLTPPHRKSTPCTTDASIVSFRRSLSKGTGLTRGRSGTYGTETDEAVLYLKPDVHNYLTEEEASVLRKKRGSRLFDDDEPNMMMRRKFTSRFEKSVTWTTKEYLHGVCCCDFIATLVMSKPFEYGVMLMVLVNAIMIGFETEHMASAETAQSTLGFRICESLFCLVFTVELLLRMIVLGPDFFRVKGWEWNWADCIVVTLQIVEELTIIFSGYTGAGGNGVLNFSFVRILRVLRLVRVVRIMRVLRYMSELRTLIFSISSSLKPLAWTIVLIMMMIYICAIYFTQLVTDHFHSTPGDAPHPDLKHYFGSLGSSFLSLFECITGGVDWDTVLDPLRREISPLLVPVFCLYIAFAVLAMLNTITGVFVESSIRSARDQTDNFMLNTVREAFLSAGGSITGVMTMEGLETQLDTPHMKAYFKSIDVDTSQAKGLFLLLDRDGSGEIDFEEFLSGCLRLRGPTKALDLQILTHEVRLFAAKFRNFSNIIQARLGVMEPEDTASTQIQALEGDSFDRQVSLEAVVKSLTIEGPSPFFMRTESSLQKRDSAVKRLPSKSNLGASMPNVPYEPAPTLQVDTVSDAG